MHSSTFVAMDAASGPTLTAVVEAQALHAALHRSPPPAPANDETPSRFRASTVCSAPRHTRARHASHSSGGPDSLEDASLEPLVPLVPVVVVTFVVLDSTSVVGSSSPESVGMIVVPTLDDESLVGTSCHVAPPIVVVIDVVVSPESVVSPPPVVPHATASRASSMRVSRTPPPGHVTPSTLGLDTAPIASMPIASSGRGVPTHVELVGPEGRADATSRRRTRRRAEVSRTTPHHSRAAAVACVQRAVAPNAPRKKPSRTSTRRRCSRARPQKHAPHDIMLPDGRAPSCRTDGS